MAMQWWKELLKLKPFERPRSGLEFLGEFSTDGVAAALLLGRRDAKEPEPRGKKRKQQRQQEAVEREAAADLAIGPETLIVGLDPGRNSLFTTMNQHGYSTHAARGEVQSMNGQKKGEATILRWKKVDPDISRIETAMPTPKTASMDKLKQYLGYYHRHLPRLLEFYGRRKWGKLKFRKFIAMKKTLAKLARRICTPTAGAAPAKDVIVGFGNLSNVGGCIKGSPRGPVAGLKHALQHVAGAKVIIIDEHLTTRLCCTCHHRMTHPFSHVVVKEGPQPYNCVRKTVISVLHCPNGCPRTTINRDLNAATNMLHLLQCQLLGLERHPCFVRGEKKEGPFEECSLLPIWPFG
jgi:hypothetical protein